MPRKYPTMQDRIIARSVLSDDFGLGGERCWIWIGARNSTGYGKLSVRIQRRGADGYRRLKSKLAHRVALVAFQDRMIGRRVVRHLCNQPLCVNPAHLAGGTQRQNVRECVQQGRHRNGREKER